MDLINGSDSVANGRLKYVIGLKNIHLTVIIQEGTVLTPGNRDFG